MNRYDLTGKRALVTGGGSGIGFASAQLYLKSGATVEIWGRDQEAAELVAWLSSDACSFNTGVTFDLSGGRAVY